MVGDSLESDIKGGNMNGFDTILVKSGLYSDKENHKLDDSLTKPKYIVEDAFEAVNHICEIHNL